MFRHLTRPLFFLTVVLLISAPRTAHTQEPPRATQPPARPQSSSGLGLDLFAGVGVTWPDASDSFEAVNLRSNPIDFGGGARVTGLWRDLFLQVSGAHWSDTGDRVFIDDEGERFPLGITLDVSATFVDGSLGFKWPLGKGRNPSILYLGGGAGFVRYSESSPFAEPGEDVDATEPSYHALAGVEIPIFRRVAAIVDTKYRFIPDLLGDGGASAVLGDESFGGFNATFGVRVGFGGPRPAARPPSAPAPTKPASPSETAQSLVRTTAEGSILETAPVYLLPDSRRTPLANLKAGTGVTVVEDKGDWLRIEFRGQYGTQVGWVQRKFVRLPGK